MDADIIIAKSRIMITSWLESIFQIFSLQSPWFGLTWWQIYFGFGVIVLAIWVVRHFLGLGWRQVDTAISSRPDNKTKASKPSKTSTTKTKE